MRLKQIQLQGFKSFVERTVLNFTDDITCVVGPNGCGKSNLVDAVRWVLGTQSSKALRGDAMEDVVFHGTNEMAAVGMAEVTLIFDNTSAICPAAYLGFTEIAVTRRYFRSGESEFYINRAACRLKDIVDLFLGSGLGAKAYSIVEQGSIDKIITMKPEQRRTLIEEAAGVSKYRVRKQEATRKMEATRQNLLRARDVIAELKRQMNSLSRQSKKAERYKKYRAQLKEIELELAAHKGIGIGADRVSASASIKKLADDESELAVRVEKAEAGIEHARTELLDLEKELSDWQARSLEAAREVEHNDRALAMLRQESQQRERDVARIDGERQEIEGRRKATLAEIESLGSEEAGLKQQMEVAAAQLKETEESRARKEDEFKELLEATEVLEKHARGLRTGVEKLADRIEWNQRKANELAAATAGLGNRREKIAADMETRARANLTYNEKLFAARKQVELLEDRLADRETDLAATKTRAAVSSDRAANLAQELAEVKSRLRSLREMEKNFEGYERGVKAIMERRDRLAREGVNGTYGLIAEVVKTEPEYETALEAVLGERLQTIFVKDVKDGLENVAYLRETGEGRSRFMPIRDAAASAVEVPAPLSAIGATSLSGLVSASDQFAPVVQSLIGDALLVEDLETAATVRGEIGATNPLVTKDGSLIDGLGAIAGGSADSFSGVLAKKREADELTRSESALSAERQQVESELEGLRASIKSGEIEVAELKDQLHRVDIEKNNLEKDLRQGTDAYNSLGEQLEALQKELEKTQTAATDLEAESEEIKKKIETDQAAAAKFDGELAGRRETLSGLREQREALNQRATAARVSAASLREKIESHNRHRERLTRSLDDFARNLTQRETQSGEARARIADLAVEAERLEAAKSEAVVVAKGVEEQGSVKKSEYETKSASLREAESMLKQSYREREQTKESRMEAELALSQLNLQWEGLTESVMDKYGLELERVIADHGEAVADDYPSEDRRAEREQLRVKIERMGEVNPTAIEEFEEVSERHGFLSSQEADLIDALENLEEAIAKINGSYRSAFKKTFDEVNQKFQEVFPKLFNGGQAMLTLTDPNDLLEAGVEIIAQPPGKKMNSIALLSGGEKALTSSGLIVALFLVKPSPFCLLDEVDAALDDVNVGRFNRMVEELSKISQLIIITHNKRTMELADSLYGVTMEKKGVSSIVSVKFNQSENGGAEAGSSPNGATANP